jgi:PhoH-like ATPase
LEESLVLAYDCVIGLNDVSTTTIDQLYAEGKIPATAIPNAQELYPHDKLVITNCVSSNSALGLVDKTSEQIRLVREPVTWGVHPRNKEQRFLMSLLQNNSIKFQLILGRAGTGKTLIAYAAALHQVFDEKNYDRLVLTKPTYEVGAGPGLGTVPGDIDEKFAPFLINFRHIAEELNVNRFYQAREQVAFEPIQRMRGASYINTLVVADEVQSLDRHEMKTLVTRIGKGSKLILMGDLEQIDRRIKREDTGLHKLAINEDLKKSPLCATVELIKNERSEISELLNRALE